LVRTSVRAIAENEKVTISLAAFEAPTPVVILRVAVAGLLIIIVLALVATNERQPHVESGSPPVSLSMQPTPQASGALLPLD